MSAKNRANAVLARLTGYRLVRRRPANPAPKPARPQKRGWPSDFDEASVTIIEQVWPYTMTSHQKIFGLIEATRYVVRNNIPGDVVECGVWRGGSMQAVARTLLESGEASRDLYLFDTFEGMTKPTKHDVRHDGQSAAEMLKTKGRRSRAWAVASLDDVKRGFADVPYPSDKIHYVKGPVEKTIPGALPDTIAILRLDTDWYESTRHELAHAYERLSPGGILIVDDYGHWGGSRKAVDEFLDQLDEPLLLNRLSQGRIAVKPFPRAS